ncbi:MAG: hypothetical protein EBU70_08735 [Actinobacteria bacterium]|nr:hypothetical protein [Actinomycetota bacterium]
MDVLEAGAPSSSSPGTSRRVAWSAGAIAAVLIAITVSVAGVRWWVEQSTPSDRLEILAIETVGPFAISGEDLPAGWPTGLVAPALRLRLDVAGDPQRAMRLRAAGETDAYATSGTESATIAASERVGVDVVVTPADCGTPSGADPISPLIDAEGARVPLTSAATRALASALDSLCPAPGAAPAVSLTSARVDVSLRDRILTMRIRVPTIADRLVLQPRDSTGFQGGSDVEATMNAGTATARMSWLVSPAEAAGLESPTVRVRAFTLIAGRAYPWVVDLRVPRISPRAPGAEPRNDGVDLAEVAPRPSA